MPEHIFRALNKPREQLFRGNCTVFSRNQPHSQSDEVAYVESHTGRLVTFKQFWSLVERAAYVLSNEYAVKKGDVVAIFAESSIMVPLLHHAVLSLGGIISPISIAYNAEEYHHCLVTGDIKYTFAGPEFLKTVDEAVKLGGTQMKHNVPLEEFSSALERENRGLKPIEISEDDAASTIAYLCFSSGTSGNPKAVMLSHLNISSNSQMTRMVDEVTFSDKASFLAVLPLTHIFGLQLYIHLTLCVGFKTVISRKFDLKHFLDTVVEHKVSHIALVPPILVLLAKHPLVDQYPNLSDSLRFIISGAAPLSESLAHAVMDRLKVMVVQGYGLTETSPVALLSGVEKPAPPGSAGRLIPYQECRLVDEEGQDVSQINMKGEIWLRGPNIMMGYYKNKEATDDCVTPDGWFKTGDVAVVDEKGEFFIVDRIKELIKSKGHQVAPAELEALLLTSPDVLDCAVIGVKDEEQQTELPRGYIVFKEGADILAVKSWFDSKVARHKRLWGGIVPVDAIPKSPSGKILRRFLRDRKGDKALYPGDASKLTKAKL